MATDMSKEAMKLALEAAYFAGWNASGEGYNAEYPFGDHARNPEKDAAWVKGRDNALREALAEQPAQQEPVACFTVFRSIAEERNTRFLELESLPDGEHYFYTSPPKRKPLTNEQIGQAARDAHIAFCLDKHQTYEHALTRAIEAAHGIKENT